MPQPRLDANESAFFARELRYISSKAYDKVFPELKARVFIPVNNEVSAGMKVYAFEPYEPVGRAKIISGSAKDLPRVDVIGKEDEVRIRQVGDKYGYNTQEIRASAATGKRLPQRRANAARQAFEQKIDHIGALGDSEFGLGGILNQALPTIYSIPNGAGGTADWASKTPDEILADLNGIINNQVDVTKEAFPPDTILLPVDQYALIASTPRSANSDTTILEFFLSKNPYIKNVFPWHYCKGAGAGATDRMVAYKMDPDYVELIVPMEFTQYEPQMEGLDFEIPCEGETGGVCLYYPLSMSYGDGI